MKVVANAAAVNTCVLTPTHAPLWLLALVTFSGTVAMHMFVPTLPAISHEFYAEPNFVQLTISAYILGLAVGQLCYGPASDRFGRKSVLQSGLCLYVAGSIAAWTAESIQVLIVARLIQGIGGCAGIVLGRAIIRDSVIGTDATKRLALLNAIVVTVPILAPLAGVTLVKLHSWRLLFMLMSLFGVACLFFVWRMLPETRRIKEQCFSTVVSNFWGLLKTRHFLGMSLGGSLSSTSIYAYIAAAPFIYIHDLHATENEMAIFIALNFTGAWLGNFGVSQFVSRTNTERLFRWGLGISLSAATTMALAATYIQMDKFTVVSLMMIFTFGAGIISPLAISESLNANPLAVGSASGIYGFFQMCVGAVSSYAVTFNDIGEPIQVVTLILFTCMVMATLCFRLAKMGR